MSLSQLAVHCDVHGHSAVAAQRIAARKSDKSERATSAVCPAATSLLHFDSLPSLLVSMRLRCDLRTRFVLHSRGDLDGSSALRLRKLGDLDLESEQVKWAADRSVRDRNVVQCKHHDHGTNAALVCLHPLLPALVLTLSTPS